MTGSMYAAVAGLKTHMSALNVIGNNVSNVNTYGYKATRYTFNEALYTTVRGGSNGTTQAGGRNPAQVGFGANVGTIDLDMSSKNYSPTGRALDTMIDGDGFFIVGDKETGTGASTISLSDATTLKGMNLTRLGNFNIDAGGYLVDGNGSVVWGFLEAKAPATDSESTESDETDSADWTTKNPHNKISEGVYATNTTPVLTALRMPMACEIVNDAGEVIARQPIWPEYTAGSDTDAGKLTEKFSATPEAYNGFENTEDLPPLPENFTGSTDSLKVQYSRLEADTVSFNEKSGAIQIITSDDQVLTVGFLALAKVTNPNGVTHVDGRYYQALDGAGEVRVTSIKGALEDVESAGDTVIVTGGLESSGTDLATEITNMITIQRGYQANTRIVTVTDSMLEELVNMKR